MGILNEYVWKGEYKYYDTPEGEDCLKKLFYVTKYTGVLGLYCSTVDTLMYSHPKGLGAIVGRYAYITLPIIGMGAAFTAATCAATNLRKKDDKLNYFLGGGAVGSVLGAWKKSYKVGGYGCLAIGLLAAVVKDSIENNWHLITPREEVKRMYSNSWWLRQDWSLTTDPGKTWKRSETE